MFTREKIEALEEKNLAPYAMKSKYTAGRKYQEPKCANRTCYQRDRDRIVHSEAFRKLEYKTQVFVIFEGDYDFAAGIYNSIIPANTLKLKISDNSFGASGMANTTDRPVLFVNAADDTLDRHTYSANNSTGFSEEKIIINRDSSPINWANSQVFNGTPGFRNSVTPLNYDLKIKSLTISPQIPIQGQDVQIFTSVINDGYFSAASYTAEVYKRFAFQYFI